MRTASNLGGEFVSLFHGCEHWPRGLPLDHSNPRFPPLRLFPKPPTIVLQQGLANDNPDVDAIYRLSYHCRRILEKTRRVALRAQSWCPFIAKTTWWRDASRFYISRLLFLSLTDIWRSFVRQRIALGPRLGRPLFTNRTSRRNATT